MYDTVRASLPVFTCNSSITQRSCVLLSSPVLSLVSGMEESSCRMASRLAPPERHPRLRVQNLMILRGLGQVVCRDSLHRQLADENVTRIVDTA